MEKAKVVLLCCLAAALYGIAHDEITVRVCAEYFTIAHPPLFPTASRTLLAACWGIAATVWAGAAFGVVLASVSQSDGSPPVPISRLRNSVAGLLCAMAMTALAAGILGFHLSLRSMISVPAGIANVIPVTAHNRFMAVWLAHIASYVAGFAGGAILIYRLWRERGRPRAIPLFPQTKLGMMRAIMLVAIVVGVIYFRLGRS